ncbi:adapter protein MecA 1/2 [Amphibacillus marinus]|uniref:Adapter protein MecA 1/2 n=1 Tax=Amphibacillus marinus TaxID=872970 RepID=A0A1H8GD60_9BACI|nr:genetic competence negative regulator [Amphibacillus marinus]SEN42101.1 adapter protein MecA 1/2 [Amphibacillus marinus]
MRLERLSSNQFKIFLTFDDLMERGLTEEIMWQDLPAMQALFHDMMFEASDELDFELAGVLSVQVYMLQAQGMLIIVTQELLDDDDDYIEMQVTLDESDALLYVFDDFEDIIQLSHTLGRLGIDDGSVYFFDHNYYVFFTDSLLEEVNQEDFIALLSEYSEASVVSPARIMEYGNTIISEKAMHQLRHTFK